MFENIRSKVLDKKQLPALKQNHPGKKIVFCTGCYDILQSGHAVFFNQCKAFGDILVVGVGKDSIIKQLKGPSRPVNPENNRVYLVAAMEDVDYAVLNDTSMIEGKIDFKEVFELLKPHVYVLNEDDSGIEAKKALCERFGVSMQLVPRIVPPELAATSSTRIIDKINFSYKAPLRIDFAGGWTDVPFIMNRKKGYVSNMAIKPLIELKSGKFNFSGYPRGSGLSTSTAVKVLELISSKDYNAYSKSLAEIAEDLFNLENKELNWAIGRQDQYSIVYGGFHCFEFGDDYAKPKNKEIPKENFKNLKKQLLIIHTGISRNAQMAVEEVYRNHKTKDGQLAIDKLAEYGVLFYEALAKNDIAECGRIMELNYMAQQMLAPSTSNNKLEEIYSFAKKHGTIGGKIAGAGGGGAFLLICENPESLKIAMKKEFVETFEIDYDFEFDDIKSLNTV
ncbi:MAG: adenylyltransferase/cytidyltransferase family protein [Bacteroidales bacterium]|nr:adenylyltransferase/cytidyltransferase family protein [Bacteroidales bacterium]